MMMVATLSILGLGIVVWGINNFQDNNFQEIYWISICIMGLIIFFWAFFSLGTMVQISLEVGILTLGFVYRYQRE